MKQLEVAGRLEEHFRDCRNEFIKIYEVEPNFDLAPADVPPTDRKRYRFASSTIARG